MYTGNIGVISNREDVELKFQALDDDTGEPIDLSTASIVASIFDRGVPLVTLSTDGGTITLPEMSVFRIVISRMTMTTLSQKEYQFGVAIENNGSTKTVISGSISVVDGNVPV